MKKLFILFQYLAPQHGISRLAGLLANSRTVWFKNLFIAWFIKRYQVDMTEAEQPERELYLSFNDFFTRALRADARPVAADTQLIICPADGVISEIGEISGDRLLQAKGKAFSLLALLGGNPDDAAQFQNGSFATVYLSPKDYHRVHMPLAGRLLKMIYLPGKLFSVNQTTSESVPDLFARNERLVCIFATDAGLVAQILVGAMVVAAISTVWSGQICPGTATRQEVDYRSQQPAIQLAKAAEMGRFSLGSTVIVLFGPAAIVLNQHLRSGSAVRIGTELARIASFSC